MKPLYLLVAGLLILSCNPGEKKEETTSGEISTDLSSGEYMNAYLDSINDASDSLANMYGRILETASRSIDSAKMQMTAQLPHIDMLNQRLDTLNMAISNLKSAGKITEEDYEDLSKGIDMGDLSRRAETLRTLGIDPRLSTQ